jgi:hypothetical protein
MKLTPQLQVKCAKYHGDTIRLGNIDKFFQEFCYVYRIRLSDIFEVFIVKHKSIKDEEDLTYWQRPWEAQHELERITEGWEVIEGKVESSLPKMYYGDPSRESSLISDLNQKVQELERRLTEHSHSTPCPVPKRYFKNDYGYIYEVDEWGNPVIPTVPRCE